VNFTRYELLKLLGWGDSGASYERIEEALNRWVGVTLFYDKAWWDKDEKTWVDANSISSRASSCSTRPSGGSGKPRASSRS